MRTRYADRLWVLGGALAAVLMLSVGWLLVIGPQYTQASALRDEVETAELRLGKLRRELAELKKQNDDVGRYRAELKAAQLALPTDPGMPDFITELEKSGNRTDVDVTTLTVGTATRVAGVPGEVYQLPLTLNATGTASSLDRFVKELQQQQPRAVLIRNVDLSSSQQEGGGSNVALAITMDAFMAPTVTK